MAWLAGYTADHCALEENTMGFTPDHCFDFTKYRGFTPVKKVDRRWPDNVLEKAPIWCSVDLRDGNQALVEPMNAGQKLRLWEQLLAIGF